MLHSRRVEKKLLSNFPCRKLVMMGDLNRLVLETWSNYFVDQGLFGSFIRLLMLKMHLHFLRKGFLNQILFRWFFLRRLLGLKSTKLFIIEHSREEKYKKTFERFSRFFSAQTSRLQDLCQNVLNFVLFSRQSRILHRSTQHLRSASARPRYNFRLQWRLPY